MPFPISGTAPAVEPLHRLEAIHGCFAADPVVGGPIDGNPAGQGLHAGIPRDMVGEGEVAEGVGGGDEGAKEITISGAKELVCRCIAPYLFLAY